MMKTNFLSTMLNQFLKLTGKLGIALLVVVAVGVFYFFMSKNNEYPTNGISANFAKQGYSSHLDSMPKTLVVGKSYKALKVDVIKGHVFDVYLENRHRYQFRLFGILETPLEARDEVVKLLNDRRLSGEKLIIVPKFWDSEKECWFVDIYFDSNRSATLTEWLRAKDLVYSL